MLRRAVVHTIGAKPALESVIEEFVQILTRDGERYAEVDVALSPSGEALHVLDLERRNRDGSIDRLDAGRFGGPPPSAAGDGLPVTHMAEALPGAEPGVIYRIRYRREWMSFPLPHVYLEVPLAGPLPIEAMSVEVRAARNGAFHWGFRHHERTAPETSDGQYGRAHLWRFAKIDAVVPESLVAPSGEPALLVSTFPDWTAFSAWYRRLIRLASEVTPEISSMAAQLTAVASSPRDKVRRLAEFVTGLRYVAVPLGVNSHRPHAAANVLRNRYGDCKDKANLLNTMLASLGIEAQLVLVPRFTQADEATPGLAFNHAISRVALAGEVLWIDTTDETTRFGLLPPGDPGRKVLVIEEGTAALTMLPEPLASDHRLELAMEVPLQGGPAAGRLEARTTGFVDYRLRQTARDLADVARNTPLIAVDHRPVAGQFSLAEQRSTDASDLGRTFEWSASGSWTGVVAAGPDGARSVRAPFWIPAEWEEALHRRRAPLPERRLPARARGNGPIHGRGGARQPGSSAAHLRAWRCTPLERRVVARRRSDRGAAKGHAGACRSERGADARLPARAPLAPRGPRSRLPHGRPRRRSRMNDQPLDPELDPAARLERLPERVEELLHCLETVIVGERETFLAILYALLSRGHALLVGVPGVGKTLLVNALARVLGLPFSRIQFTPDLMPSDITGKRDHRRGSHTGAAASSSCQARCSRTCCWPTRSIGRLRRRRRRCSRRCRSGPSHVGGQAASARRAFPRARDAEPDRAGRHLPPSGGAARSIPVPPADRLSERGGRAADRRAASRSSRSSRSSRCGAGTRSWRCATPSRGSPLRPRWSNTRCGSVGRAGPRAARLRTSSAAGCAGARARARPRTWSWLRRHARPATGASTWRAKTCGRSRPWSSDIAWSEASRRRSTSGGPTRSSRSSSRPSREDARPEGPRDPLGIRAPRAYGDGGAPFGHHESPFHGLSVEFSDYRNYQPGDALSHVDWRLYARSERLYVKRFEEETSARTHVLCDTSASMSYRGADAWGSKLECAAVLAAALGWLLIRQRDAVGLLTFQRKGRTAQAA